MSVGKQNITKPCIRCKTKPRALGSRMCYDCQLKERREKKERIRIKKEKRTIDKKIKRENSTPYLDGLWSKATKYYYGDKCEVCGKTGVNSHHIYSRSNLAVRWDIDNCSCLCVYHHLWDTKISGHKAPAELIEFLKNKRGIGWYNRLRQKANMSHRDKDEQKKILLKIIDKFENNKHPDYERQK